MFFADFSGHFQRLFPILTADSLNFSEQNVKELENTIETPPPPPGTETFMI